DLMTSCKTVRLQVDCACSVHPSLALCFKDFRKASRSSRLAFHLTHHFKHLNASRSAPQANTISCDDATHLIPYDWLFAIPWRDFFYFISSARPLLIDLC